jgi:Ca2+-transporting ATPase
LLSVIVSAAALAAAVAVPQLRGIFGTELLTMQELGTALGISAAVPVLSALFSGSGREKDQPVVTSDIYS